MYFWRQSGAAPRVNASLAAERRPPPPVLAGELAPPAALSGAAPTANISLAAERLPPPPAALSRASLTANVSLAAERLPLPPAALSRAVPMANISPAAERALIPSAGLHRPAPGLTRMTRNPILKKYLATKILRTLNHARLVWDHQLKPKGLLCGHINIRSMMSKREQIEHLLCDSNIDILGMSETWLSSSSPEAAILLPGCTVFRQDRNGKGGGVLLNVENLLKCTQLMAPSDVKIEYVSVKVSLFSEMSFIIICLYCPPSARSDFYDQLKLLLNHFSSDSEIILVGDLNVNWDVKKRQEDSQTNYGSPQFHPVNRAAYQVYKSL